MKVSRFSVLISIIVLLFSGFSMQAHADLNLLGQGTSAYGTYNLIYDTDLDITWYDYTTTSGNSWQNQVDWADALSVTFGSITYTDWRLPTTTQPDPSCDEQDDLGGGFPLQGWGYNCTGSEMGHLYYTELGNKAFAEPGYGLTNTGDFQNLRPERHWTGTEYAPDTGSVWEFNNVHGGQGFTPKHYGFYAIAVRPGLAVVPEPVSSTLFVIGAATMGFRVYRKKRTI